MIKGIIASNIFHVISDVDLIIEYVIQNKSGIKNQWDCKETINSCVYKEN